MDSIESSGTGGHEIITLQLGNYSNFVGAHFFNLQGALIDEQSRDEFDPHVLWRESRGFGGSRVFSPRVLIVDLKDNLTRSCTGSENQQSSTSKSVLDKKMREAEAFWDGKIERIFTDGDEETNGSGPPPNPKKLKRLDVSCTWGDYAKWKSEESQQFSIPNFSHNSEKGMLSTYSQGLEIWKGMEEDIWDGIRRYAEDCDRLQGFHLLVDQDDGFTGIGAGILQNISDEYDRKSCFGLGLSPPGPVGVTDEGDKKEFRRRVSNTALLWNAFNHHSSVFSPLGLCKNIFSPESTPQSLPYLKYSADSAYSSSSIIATTLDTLMSSYRTRNSAILLPEFTSFLSSYGRKMTSIAASFPFPFEMRTNTFFGTLQKKGLDSLWSLTPQAKPDLEKSTGNYFVVRGIPSNCTISDEEMKMLRGGPEIKNPESCFEIFARDSFPRSVNNVSSISTPITISHPFPSIFDTGIVDKYHVGKRFLTGNPEVMWELSTITSAHNTPETGHLIENLIKEAGGTRGGSSKITVDFVSSDLNLEFDDYLQCFNDLSTLREAYKVYSDST